MSKRPVIGIPCDVRRIGLFNFHAVADKYIHAVQQSVGDVVLLPSLGSLDTLKRLMQNIDGVFLTGSPSNVEPEHYLGVQSREGTWHDPLRDATTLPLIPFLIEQGMPLFGVCRGFQEMNVALGGSLHQHVQEIDGMMDHRDADVDDVSINYQDVHEVFLPSDSLLYSWLKTERIMVNSLHQQGIKDLASGLAIEAKAPDGLIEAFRVTAAKTFAYAVQWHPEWLFNEKPASIALFKAFKEACEARMCSRQ
ncbi:gamma-glutamyl-gamma-aminobutyrate hydrolase family protein [Neisseria sp. Ec49-e6-T10]|uniref:gamma-glutamyl-gamma-aminobutyrate hydrolase family protein n=1 Tax=Neisseria sp. Ec49-e6-T10 TaxID=3140744 RepID=UPI003EBA74C2